MMRARGGDELLHEVNAEAGAAEDERVARGVVRIVVVAVLVVDAAVAEEPRRDADARAASRRGAEGVEEAFPELAHADLGVVIATEEPQLAALIHVERERAAELGMDAEHLAYSGRAAEAGVRRGQVEEVPREDEAGAGVFSDERGDRAGDRADGVPHEVQIGEYDRSGQRHHATVSAWTTRGCNRGPGKGFAGHSVSRRLAISFQRRRGSTTATTGPRQALMDTTEGTPTSGAMMDQLQRALATQDFDAFASLYAEDATLEEVSSINPPAHPLVVKGREAIRQHLHEQILRDPLSGWRRQIQQATVVDGLETEDAIAFTEERVYVAGDKAIAQHVAHKRGGCIVHDRLVLVWDPD
jgi:hypothetical protein